MSDRVEAAIRELAAAIRDELVVHPPAPAPERLLSIPEAAERMSIGRTLLYRLIGRGEVRTLAVGRRVLVPESAIAEYIAASGR